MWGAVSSQAGDATEGPRQHKCNHTSIGSKQERAAVMAETLLAELSLAGAHRAGNAAP